MSSKETPLYLNSIKKDENKDYFKLARKMLYKKYGGESFSVKKIFTDFLIFNNKCRLTLFFKEFLISDDGCEYLRNFYEKEDLYNILNKILEIYCLYSKIYPNYIILKENKFLYKNIRKKQKMIDEINKNNEIKKNGNNTQNKDNELFTLSVRNEIKEFQENTTNNKNNMDSISNRKNNSINRKRINDNWVFISNKKLNLNFNDSKKKNNNQFNKNMSVDSFWTNDTNNLSVLLNAINEKKVGDENDENKNENKNENKSKKKHKNDRNINHKYLKSKNIKKKETKSSSKKTFKKVIYKKIENKKLLSDNSRNNNFLKIKNKQINLNNIETIKPLSSSLSNNSNIVLGLINKGQNLYNHLLTEKNLEKEIKNNIHQYYSIQRDTSDKNVGKNAKKFLPCVLMKKKYYSKDFSKESNTLSIKKKENELNNIKNVKKVSDKLNKYIRKKSPPHEFLKIILDESRKNCFKESTKEENNKNGSFNKKILYNTNNNFNALRNKKYYLKKYFTNNNLNQKTINQRYTSNLTESNSQTFVKSKKEKELNSSYYCNNNNNNDIIFKKFNSCQTTTNYYILKNNNINININNISQNKCHMKKQKTEGTFFGIRDKMLKVGMGTTYIKKKCFSPMSNIYNRRFTLSKSWNIQKEKKNNKIIKEKLVEKQKIDSGIKNKLANIKRNIRKQIIQNDNKIDKNYLVNKSINKKSSSNLIMDISQKENRNSLNILNSKDNLRNAKKVYLRKNFSPTLTHYNLYKSNNKGLTKSKNSINNNSELIEYHHENLFIKRKNKIIKINNNDSSINKLANKENTNYYLNNQKFKIKEKNYLTKSKTEYQNFLPKNKSINKCKNNENDEINKKNILKRFQKKPRNFYIFSKDKTNKNSFNEIAFQRFNNLSNSTIYNSNLNEYTITRNINNSLSNSMNNINDFQTPFSQKKRWKLMKKIIYQEQKENVGHISNIENVSNNITIKVNRTKFLERVKEKMRNRITLNQVEN